MQIYTLRFIATKGFVSSAIKFVEGTVAYADHVEAKNRSGDGWIGAHAGIGVKDMPLDWTPQCEIVWERQYELRLTDKQYELAMGFLESKIGTPYDYADILGILFHDQKIEDPRRIMCSCLQYEVLCACGVTMLNVLKEFAHLVTPETLHLSPLLIGNCAYEFPAAQI